MAVIARRYPVSSGNSRKSDEESISYSPGEFLGQDVENEKILWDKMRELPTMIVLAASYSKQPGCPAHI